MIAEYHSQAKTTALTLGEGGFRIFDDRLLFEATLKTGFGLNVVGYGDSTLVTMAKAIAGEYTQIEMARWGGAYGAEITLA